MLIGIWNGLVWFVHTIGHIVCLLWTVGCVACIIFGAQALVLQWVAIARKAEAPMHTWIRYSLIVAFGISSLFLHY